MPAVQFRHLRVLSAALIVLGLPASAQARHDGHHHHHHHLQDYASGEGASSGGAPRQGGGFAAPTAATIRACNDQAEELQKMRIGPVLETVQPSDAQRAALERIGSAAADAANKLTASCPKDVPAKLTDRLDTMRASLDAIKAALSPLRPAFVSAYAMLDDEQKARLVALSLTKPSSPQSPSARKASGTGGPGADNKTQSVSLDCGQWPAMLKSWPVNRIEGELSLSDEQHAALYTLMAADYRAAAFLGASCHDTNVLTPVARLDAELGRVDALHHCIDAIAPALAGFVTALNDEQNVRLNAVLGVAPQPQKTAR